MSRREDGLGVAADGQWATFVLGGELFALAVEEVQEVLMAQPLTPVPHAPSQMIGLLNLRGQIMPAIDLRRRLGIAPRPEDGAGKLLVLRASEGAFSILVDDIGDVLALPGKDWRPPPDTLAGQHRRFVFAVCPVQGRIVLGLRADQLGFDDDDGPIGDTGDRRVSPN